MFFYTATLLQYMLNYSITRTRVLDMEERGNVLTFIFTVRHHSNELPSFLKLY